MDSEFLLDRIVLDQDMDGPFVLLREVEGARTIRIRVSLGDAASLLAAYEGIDIPRPMTHDLVIMLLKGLSARVKRVNIPKLVGNVFFGEVVLEHNGKEQVFKCRSSDAIHIALRLEVPIFVASEVLDKLVDKGKCDAAKNGWLNLLAMLADDNMEKEEVN